MTDRTDVHMPALISEQLGLSRSEARRLINQGAVKADGRQMLDFDLPAHVLDGITEITVGTCRSFLLGPVQEDALNEFRKGAMTVNRGPSGSATFTIKDQRGTNFVSMAPHLVAQLIEFLEGDR